MSFDLFLRKRSAESAARLRSMEFPIPGVSLIDDGVHVEGIGRMATVDLNTGTLSGSGRAGPFIAWVAGCLRRSRVCGYVFDPQTGGALRDVPTDQTIATWLDSTRAEINGPTLAAPTLGSPIQQAAGFAELLMSRELAEISQIELLAEELAAVLALPAEERPPALETLLLGHNTVEELYADEATLAQALDDWG